MQTPKKAKKFRPNPDARLMDQVKEVLRYHHYAYRTEVSYCQWILRYLHPVLTQEAVQRMFSKMNGTHLLMAKLLYGAGLRLMECLRLRSQDVEFGQNKIFSQGCPGLVCSTPSG